MAYKNTVAIIGATTKTGARIAKSIVADYRLLLMDVAQPQLDLLQSDLVEVQKNAEVEVVNCCKDASWEADIIVVAIDELGLDDIAEKMKVVSNGKIVVHFTLKESMPDRLQHLLPYAKVATVLLSNSTSETQNDHNAFIHGKDREAIELANDLLKIMGCSLIKS